MTRTRVENRLGQIRKSRGIGASDLARRVNVSRQTIYAIEAGSYVPNTELALHLARELEVGVDELFSLAAGSRKSPEALAAEVLSAAAPAKGQPVRVCQIGARWVSVPVSATPYYMPEADGVIKRPGRANGRADLLVFAKEDAARKRLLLAGCDPATSLLSSMVERISGVEIVAAAASSKLALAWLKAGKVHIAGSHLEDPKTGEFNLPYVRKEFPDEEILVITFARWEEGLVVAPGNPKSIRRPEDLARKGVRFVNRESGSGSRALIDKLLQKAGIAAAKVHGYDRVAYGHLAAAYCVVSGEADACMATMSAAQTFGLDFIPLNSERYDLVMRKRTADLPGVKPFLDVLQRAALRRKLEVLAGYDTSQTGVLVG
ncbi:MAG TPA: substrate-binding domain-containing protein [Bryobacteraceae bacterium]|nr:substrate-binding domain-containing protein [Bryobacteraceae bacterium]